MDSLPPAAETLFHEGTRLLTAGDVAQAELRLREALTLSPGLAEAHANLGLLLAHGGRDGEAERHYRDALALAPLRPQIHLNFGAFLAQRKRFAEAEQSYRSALVLEPGTPAAWSNLGVLLACLKREDEAECCYRTALELAPDYRTARFNLAYLLLRQGRLDEGWVCLEARDTAPGWLAPSGCPRWQGQPLAGKSLLIGCEGGYGDMIQFSRYAALAKRGGAACVALQCQPALQRLLAGMHGVDRVLAVGEKPRGHWDYWTLPQSLPLRFGTRLDSIPAELPYLFAPPALARNWAAALGPARPGELRIGLAWKGNPRFENDADRSLPSPAVLAPLAELSGVRYFSLQKEAGADAARDFGTPLQDLASGFTDFADCAAAVAQLDLVIGVDTAIVHLAGALGKPCWVLLPDYKPDWRWLSGRDDSPWYPRVMRLFRQSAAGDWNGPVMAVKAALRERLAHA